MVLFVWFCLYIGKENEPRHKKTGLRVELQEIARSWKFQIYEEEEMDYLYSKNKGADQLRSYCEADLGLCIRIGKISFFS